MTEFKRTAGNRRAGTAAIAILALMSGLSGGALAGEPAKAPSSEAALVVTYDQAFFAGFSAITAEDLLLRIPGIQDLVGQANSPGRGRGNANQQGTRGFGTTGVPILFNGRRLSGKSNDPIAALQRIQARQVVRIDVIRGSAPGLGIRVGNEGVLVNVVLEDELSTSFGSWEASAEYFTTGDIKPGGKFSYAGNWGALSYIASLSAEPHSNRRTTAEIHVQPTNPQPFGRVRLINQDSNKSNTATGSLTYGFINGDTANLNARYNRERRTLDQPSWSYTITAPGVERFTAHTRQFRDQVGDAEWELGGDFEHAFANGDSARGLFVVNSDKRPSEALFYSTPLGGAEITTRRQVVDSTRTERIGRGQYNWKIATGQSIEFGGEVALNAINQQIARFDNIAGTLRPVTLFNPDAKVTETRFESFASYSNRITPELYVEGAVDTESSRMKQRGTDVNTLRSFFFIKPRVDLRYDFSPRTQIRGRAFRTISQLDFADFVSSFSNDDARLSVILAGNPNLVPEKTWTFETTTEHRLGGDQGVVSLRAFYNKIQDAIDKILIVPNVSGVGNIGNARSYGVELKTGLRLDRLGLTRASIDATGLFQGSSVRDSFTLVDRELQNLPDYTLSVSFRQDVAWRNLSYGATVVAQKSFLASDIDFQHYFKFKPEARTFVEMRAASLIFRAEAQEIFRKAARQRFQYVGNRLNENLLRLERRREVSDTEIKFIVKGTF